MKEEMFSYSSTPERIEEKLYGIYAGDKNPLLRKKTKDYRGRLDNDLKTVISNLKMTRDKYGLYGLAANQCGIDVSIFVLNVNGKEMVCVNPRIIEKSDEMIIGKEGCASYPGLLVNVKRPEWLDVEFFDETGTLVSTRVEGLVARCFMHKWEHLNGVVFLDNLGTLSKYMAKKKKKKIMKKFVNNPRP